VSATLTPAQIAAITSHLERIAPSCPMCHGTWPDTWSLHAKLAFLPELDADLRPIPGGVPVALLKCRRCRFVAHFRAVGGDDPADVSGQGPTA
jgi:hypothetical protein